MSHFFRNIQVLRSIQVAVLAAFFSLSFLCSSYAAEIGEDGLHKQPWFTSTFKDIREDLEEAQADGKRLAIILEQRGCIYCKRLHETVFSDAVVADYIRANYMVVQYNMFGDEEVTDIDGETLTEKTAARKWRLNYTPTIMFFDNEIADDSQDAASIAVSVLPGAFDKWTTLNMFKWVVDKGYESQEPFQKYHARLPEVANKSRKYREGEEKDNDITKSQEPITKPK